MQKSPCYDGMRLVEDPEAEGYTYHAVPVGEWPGYWSRPLRLGEKLPFECTPPDPALDVNWFGDSEAFGMAEEQLPVSNEAA